MLITLLALKLAEISNRERKHLGKILKNLLNGIGFTKSKERNPVTLFIICLLMIEISILNGELTER